MSNVCLILGGAGFIGSHIADILLRNGYTVRIFDRVNTLPVHLPAGKIEVVQGDYLSFPDWGTVLQDVDYVFHTLSTTIPSTSDKDPIFDIQTNVIGNVRFINEVKKHNIKKFIFSSSGGTIYGHKPAPIAETSATDPICSYAISKLSVEKYLGYFNYHHGLDYVSLRYSNVYGIGQDPKGMLGAVTIFLELMMRGETITVFGDGNTIRDYIYIDDVTRANLLVLINKADNHIYNVGTGVGTSINELIKLISQVTGLKARINYVVARRTDVPANVLDISRITNDIGWAPDITLKEGISRLWKNLQDKIR
jgi:UDP-glucose 4-epimerase